MSEFSRAPDLFFGLKAGDHLCCIYETEVEHRAVVVAYVRQGLERGEKVIYIVDVHAAETVLGYLRDDGLAVDDFLARGQLSMATHEDTYLRGGSFDPEGMMVFLRTAMEQALAEGFTALRVTGEMSWALRGLPGSERLIEYEAKLNHFFPGSQCSAICQYDRKMFDPMILQDVMHTHPLVIIGTRRYDNFYFVPPEAFLSNRPEARLQQWIQSLQDRGRAEEALQKSAAFLKQTQEITQVGGWEYEVATQKISWTDEVYRIYEVDREHNPSDVGMAVGFYAPQAQEIINRAFQRAVELGEPYDLELEFISATGAHKWVRTIAQVERREGKSVRVFGNIMDITQSKQAQEALRSSEERFRVAQELSLNAFTILMAVRDDQGQIIDFEWTYANAMAGQILKQAPQNLVGQRLLQVLPSNRENQALFERYVRIAEGGQGDEVELEYNADGITGWFRNMAIKLGDGVAVSFSDITESNRADAALRAAYEYNRSLIEASLDPLVTIGPEGQITDVNAATERVTGYSRAELIGTDFSAYFTEPQQARASYQQAFREGSARDYALEIRHRDGRIFSVLYNASVYRDTTGKALGVFAAARDITERKRIEAAEREQRILAEALRDTAAALNSTLKFDDVLDRILENVERVVPHDADSVDLILLDHAGEFAQVVRHRTTRYDEHDLEVKNIQFSVAQARNLREIQATGAPVLIPDAWAYEGWIVTEATAWIRGNLGVPIAIKGQTIGFLSLNSALPNAFFPLDADRLRAFADQAATAIENAQLYEELQELAITDALTGVFNRHGLFRLGEREVERALRFYRPLSLVMLDIDYFKRVNDTYGHPAGDRVLRALAECCRAHVRNVDLVARYGGEEFILLLPEIDGVDAVLVAERLRQAVENLRVPVKLGENDFGASIQVTVSQGIVALTPETSNLMDLLARVDQALYAAKQAGRNCLVVGK